VDSTCVRLFAYLYKVPVALDHGAVPDAGRVKAQYLPYYGGVGGHEALGCEGRVL